MQNTLIVLLTLFSVQAFSQLDLSVKLDSYLKKSKTVPQISIGAEKVFTPKDLIISIPENKPAVAEKKVLVSPKIVKIPKINIHPVNSVKIVFAADKEIVIPAVAPLAVINDPMIKTAEANPENLIEIESDEYKMIQGLIFQEIQKKYDMAISLFVELNETKFKAHALLQYAESAYAMGLFSEYRQSILKLLDLTQDKAIRIKAVQGIVKNINAFENSDMEKIASLVQTYNVDTNKNDNYLYKQAKYFIKEENLSAAENILNQINEKSDFYMDSVLLSTSINYRKGEVNKALAKLEKVIPKIENDKKNKVRNMLILTLARLYFQKAKYAEAYQSYLKIDRSSPVWLQSVVEQAWAQILVGDHIGAAGNMFSLHTEVFRKVYLPESYIVRSVGYLNLCQYGDALHVLTDLDSRFKKTHEKLIAFQSENKDVMLYYDLVKAWFSNSTQAEINTIPRSFVAELAVHPSFTNIQKQINDFDEENSKYNKITNDFSNKDQLLRQRIITLKNELQTYKKKQAAPQTIYNSEIKNIIADIELQIVNRGKDGLKKVRAAAEQRLENKKTELRVLASNSLKERYNEMVTVLGKFLEQEEILAYEVYSGAGEHIRYQMADGKIEDRTPATLTPEEKKSYKWKFRGEIWEDEIGHYRSSLKNVCAQKEIAQKGDQ